MYGVPPPLMSAPEVVAFRSLEQEDGFDRSPLVLLKRVLVEGEDGYITRGEGTGARRCSHDMAVVLEPAAAKHHGNKKKKKEAWGHDHVPFLPINSLKTPKRPLRSLEDTMILLVLLHRQP